MQKVKHPTVKCFSVERKIFSGVYTFQVDENNLKSNGLQKPNQTFSLNHSNNLFNHPPSPMRRFEWIWA